jgi:hypothetical protein
MVSTSVGRAVRLQPGRGRGRGTDGGVDRKSFRRAPSRRCCWHTFCYFRLCRLMTLVFVKEMDDAEFVKVIPVVLFIIEKLSRPVKKILAPRIRFFGLLVQLFGGNTFRPDPTAVVCKELPGGIYRRAHVSGATAPFCLARAAENVVFNIAFTPLQDSRKRLPLEYRIGSASIRLNPQTG